MDLFDEEIFDDELYKLIVVVVQKGYSDEVIFSAKAAGAKGGVILQGKGLGDNDRKFFGFKIDPENEVVLILVKEEIVVPIMKAIYSTTDYRSGAKGLVFALPVSYVTGMTRLDNEEENQEEKKDKKD